MTPPFSNQPPRRCVCIHVCVEAHFPRRRCDKFSLIRLRRARRCWDLINGPHRVDPILISGRIIISNGVAALIENSATLYAAILYICPGAIGAQCLSA